MKRDPMKAFRDQGAKARKAGKPASSCPYRLSDALTALDARIIAQALTAWHKGWNGK